MTILKIFNQSSPKNPELSTDLPLEISEVLVEAEVSYQKVVIPHELDDIVADEELVTELKREVLPLDIQHKFPFASLMIIDEGYPNYDRLRMKYLSEHSYDRDEAFIFLGGQCLISIHLQDKVYQLLCERGDLLIIPQSMNHWIDFGETGNFAAIKCSQQAHEQALKYTGNHYADLFPRL